MPSILPAYSDLKMMVAFDQMRLKLEDLEWSYRYMDVFKNLLLGDGQSTTSRQKSDQIEIRKKQIKR